MWQMFIAVGLVLASVSPAVAQEEAVTSFYLVPRFGDGLTPRTAFRPKYFVDATGRSLIASGQFVNIPYGLEPVVLVVANTTDAEHAAISANLDVLAFPRATDDPVSAIELNELQSRLEALKFPAQWITTSLSRRRVLRTVLQLCQFFTRYAVLESGTPFAGGATLTTRFNQLTVAQREAIQRVATNFGIDASGMGGATTLASALKTIADQMPVPRIVGDGIDEAM